MNRGIIQKYKIMLRKWKMNYFEQKDGQIKRQKICSSQGENVVTNDICHFVLSVVSPVLPFGKVKQHIWRLHRHR